jgi:acyl-coenzyme A synthetase/AMP-(fatty) acid ligase
MKHSLGIAFALLTPLWLPVTLLAVARLLATMAGVVWVDVADLAWMLSLTVGVFAGFVMGMTFIFEVLSP